MILQGLEYRDYRSRINWIDIARCISIAIIVYAHTYDVSAISDFVHVFHVPVFFVLSGLVWKPAKNMKSLLSSVLINLVIPYLIAGTISIVAYQIIGSMFSGDKLSLLQCFKGLFYANSRTGLMKWNRPLWFLPCLVVTRIVWELIAKLKQETAQYGIVLLIVMAGAIAVNTDIAGIRLPWETEVAVHALLYYVVGVAIKRYTPIASIKFQSEVSRIWLALAIVISFGLCILVFRVNPQPISFQYNQYGIYPLFILGALAGTTLVGGVSLVITKSRILEIIGQNSLGVLLWHKFPVLIFQATSFGKRCMKSPDTIKSIVIGFAVVAVSIVVSIVAGIVIRKILGSMKIKR